MNIAAYCGLRPSHNNHTKVTGLNLRTISLRVQTRREDFHSLQYG
jgi:hypothetical protein